MCSTSFRLSVFSLALSAAACSATGGTPVDAGEASGQGGQSSRGGTTGTGGVSSGGGASTTGGVTNPGTGGTSDPGTGGVPDPGTGGVTNPGTGGRTNPGTGGASNLGTGGRSNAVTGGKTGAGGIGGNMGAGGVGGNTGAGGDAIDGGLVDPCTMTTPLTGGKQQCSSNSQGKTSDGYQWTIWSSGGGGCITPYNAGCAFKATWNNSGDFLARAGLQWNSTQTYDQIGTITADYAFKKSGSGGSWSYLGIYGWSKSPLVEFYIVEDAFSKFSPGSKVGTVTVDGDSYTVYKNYRAGAPSIEGTSNFDQFFSVREKSRQCGHIDLSQHFAGWAKLGLKLGKMYEAKLLVEASGGNGSVDFTYCTMSPLK